MTIIIKIQKNYVDAKIAIIFSIQLFRTLSRNTNSSFQNMKDGISFLTFLFIGYLLRTTFQIKCESRLQYSGNHY